MELAIWFETLTVSFGTGPDVCDISPQLERFIQTTDVRNGTLSAMMKGSTGSLTSIEFEPGAVADLKRAINQLAPAGASYAHELAWHDGNGHSHVQAALLGPSLQLEIRNGALALGTWQQMVAINHDTRPRSRTIEVSVIGVRA